MNKQIIDGVDVSGCKGYYFSPTGYHSCQDIPQINDLGYEQDTLCEQNPNCYYKQLLRKEQECGKWKNAYEVKADALEEAEEYIEEIEEKYHKLQEQLKASNENLREWKEANKPNGICETCTEVSVEKAFRYEQALENIKELAKGKIKWCEQGNRYCNKCKCICNEYKVLTIINEVLKDA